MFQYEFQKSRKQWILVGVVSLVLAAYYVFTAFYGAFNTFSGGALQNYNKNEDYREILRSERPGTVNEEWIEAIKNDYKALVDENCLTLEQSRKQLAEDFEGNIDFTAEEALANRYDVDYAMGVLPAKKFFENYSVAERYSVYFHSIIPMAQDPVAYTKDSYDRDDIWAMREYGQSFLQLKGYNDGQIADFWQLVERRYSGLEIVVGYSIGWDVLTSVMQYLPFTLGVALLVALGNLFAQERSFAMSPILRTTKLGRRKLLRTKVTAALVIAAGMWMLFQGAMLLAVGLYYGLEGANVTAISHLFQLNVYGLNWIQYYLIQCLFSLLGTMVYALFVCCLSSFLPVKISLPLGLIATLVTGIPMHNFSFRSSAFSLVDKVKVLTPAQLMAAYPMLQTYQSYSIGNVQLLLPYAMMIAVVLETIALLYILNRREGGK